MSYRFFVLKISEPTVIFQLLYIRFPKWFLSEELLRSPMAIKKY